MSIYIGVNNQAKKVSGIYIGNNQGQAIPIYTNDTLPNGYYPVHFIYRSPKTDLTGTDIELIPTIYTRSIIVTSTNNGYTDEIEDVTKQYIGYPLYGGSSYYCHFLRRHSYRSDRVYLKEQYVGCACGNGSFNVAYTKDASYNDTSHKYIIDINRNTSKQTYIKYENEDYQLKFTNTSSSISTESLKVFKGACNGFKLYYLEIYQNIYTDNTPTKQLYPCIRGSDMTTGLFDIKTRTFYGDSGWTAGPSVETYPNYL
jgi:hypothetical protein